MANSSYPIISNSPLIVGSITGFAAGFVAGFIFTLLKILIPEEGVGFLVSNGLVAGLIRGLN